MSRAGLRWSEEELNAHLARSGTPPPVAEPKPRARRPAGTSKLELELLSHLELMKLTPELQHRFHPERRWRFDFAFPDERVAVEVDGAIFAAENGTEAGRHARGAGRCADMEKRNAAAELGWLVLCYGPPHVRSGEAALQVERIVAARRAGFGLVRERDGVAV